MFFFDDNQISLPTFTAHIYLGKSTNHVGSKPTSHHPFGF